ncbi:uncharacterized protein MYCGRDRAFT_88783 [Zymoseptoria tritici IPO323]|uniref:Protein kinase domain-containing protein n=1 Tax=Zymoseptoria tritici (strain CBS 115943 / IPO323) TaxID=336722 RepID=F9WZL5_ZYMTI|nr:uncharacterized protein MYCGRDRAFT_88783 [Zymoseptoria tritici IPO323]EGP92682.1 hypothetical protein MYCGRDRAFT_88783 [Zymoseptoria tritici IPO323]
MPSQTVPECPTGPLPTSYLQDNYMIKKLTNGCFGDVYASIPKARADRILTAYKRALATKRKTLVDLREALQVVKISDIPCDNGYRSDSGDDLNLEVDILQRFAPASSSNIVSVLSCDPLREGKNWYTLELLTAGSLEDLLEAYTEPSSTMPFCPEAFIWHILHQLTSALLLIHFGIVGDQRLRNLPASRHGDVHLGNLLMRKPDPNSPSSFRDYPDIVLADFGQARPLPTNSAARSRAMSFHRQVRDAKDGIAAVERVARTGTFYGANLATIWDDFSSLLRSENNESGENEDLMHKMLALRRAAAQRRESRYEPLPERVSAWMARETVSWEELEEVFAVLKSS